MKIDKVQLIVFSPTGSSLNTAKTMGDVFKERMELAEDTTIDLCCETGGVVIGPHTLCIFSVPCYGGRIPAIAAERLSKIRSKCGDTLAIVCVTFGNRAYEDALLELTDCVEKNGFRVIAGCAVVAEHNIAHEYGKGRPDEEDQAQIQAFAKSIANKIRDGKEFEKPAFPGNRPYKERGGAKIPIEVDLSKCTGCGLCARECPVRAISTEAWKTDESLCVNCMRCIVYCPEGCRHIPGDMLRAMTERLRAVCGTRKDNAFFVG